VPDADCRQAFEKVKKCINATDIDVAALEAAVDALEALFASIAFVVQPAVTASTPAGRALVAGVGTTVDYGTPGEVSVDAAFGEFHLTFFCDAVPTAIT
jgi:hypothetical protein